MNQAQRLYKIAPIDGQSEAVARIRQLESSLSEQLGYEVTLIAYSPAGSGEAVDARSLPKNWDNQ